MKISSAIIVLVVLSLKTKVFKQCVLPVMTYGAETWIVVDTDEPITFEVDEFSSGDHEQATQRGTPSCPLD
ncbi:unnamed protein product [Plutella xylostella]|uniref:(diamondback moth) hypothetical protein n=1 Tax=Plutella xylostella TaxID=51655 RepID=A0A8S4GBH5_PLUXY|nr:unnamed protein product [Plutella xylostella]